MKSLHIKILVLFAFVFWGRMAEGQTICYQTYNSFSGLKIDGFQEVAADSDINQKACTLTTLINSGCVNGEDFKIFGASFFPVLAYTDLVQYQIFEDQYNETIDALDQTHDYYLFLGKEIRLDDTGTERVFFRLELKLPSCTAAFQALTAFEKDAIKSMVLKAVNDQASLDNNSIPSVTASEIDGIEKLTTIINQINQGQFQVSLEDALAASDFKEIELTPEVASANFTYSSDCGNTSFDGANLMVSDYACVNIEGNSLKNQLNEALLGINETGKQFIITSNVMPDYQERLDLAEVKYGNENNFSYLFWMHFVFSGDQVRIFYKTRTNNNAISAQQNIDEEYDKWMTGEDEVAVTVTAQDEAKNFAVTNCTDGSVFCIDGVEDIWNISYSNLKTWRAYCCLMDPDLPTFDQESFKEGVVYGVIDGIWQTITFIYDASNGISKVKGNLFFGWLIDGGSSEIFNDFMKTWEKEGDFTEAVAAKWGEDWQMAEDIGEAIYGFISNISEIWDIIWAGINEFMGNLDPRSGLNTTGYAVGIVVFEVLMEMITGGGKALFTAGENAMQVIRKIGTTPANTFENFVSALNNSSSSLKKLICKIRYAGCFVAGTKVLMAGKPDSYSNVNSRQWLEEGASAPIIAVPIEEIQLFDYVVAHKTVNSFEVKENDNILASVKEGYFEENNNYRDRSIRNDPYTSDQQRQRDKYLLNDTDWNEVVFEEVNGTSSCKLALHQDWINQKGYEVDAIISMSLPEQGISGLFRITSIKHIIPQKKPVDDEADDYGYKPVTGLFIHQSDQVWDLTFDNGEVLGVTFNHPIYSTTYGDWRFAGELKIGEKVLTKSGEATVSGKEKKEGTHTVYNLEVKELHNFLVGNVGVVVHNTCGWLWNTMRTYGGGIQETCLQHIKRLHLSGTELNKSHYGSHITDANLEEVLGRTMTDYASNASNMKFIENGYSQGKHWVIVDMSPHADLLDGAGNIGKYISQSGNTVADVKHILVTVDDNLNMINAFPTNKVLADFP